MFTNVALPEYGNRALKPKLYQPTQTMVTAGILPFRENSYGRAGGKDSLFN